MRSEKEVRKQLKRFTRELNQKIKEANKKSDCSKYSEVALWLNAVQGLAWVLEDEIVKNKKKVV